MTGFTISTAGIAIKSISASGIPAAAIGIGIGGVILIIGGVTVYVIYKNYQKKLQ